MVYRLCPDLNYQGVDGDKVSNEKAARDRISLMNSLILTSVEAVLVLVCACPSALTLALLLHPNSVNYYLHSHPKPYGDCFFLPKRSFLLCRLSRQRQLSAIMIQFPTSLKRLNIGYGRSSPFPGSTTLPHRPGGQKLFSIRGR